MTSKHYSEEALLAYADGELPAARREQVKRHLESCWSCRARLSDLEEQAQHLGRLVARQSFPSPGRIAGAKAGLFERIRDAEQTLSLEKQAPHFSPFWGSRSGPGPAVMAVLCLLVAAAGVWRLLWQAPDPRQTLAAAIQAEKSFQEAPLPAHQVFDVEIEQVEPERETRRARLEVWAAPRTRQLAVHWKDGQDRLKRAFWRTRAEGAYLYDRTGAEAGVTPVAEASEPGAALAELPGSDLTAGALETGFLRWIRSLSWRPVSLSRDFARFAARERVVLELDRRGRSGPAFLTAYGESGGVAVHMTLKLDPETHRALAAQVRYTRNGRTVKLRLTARQSEHVPPERLRPAVFEPRVPGQEGGEVAAEPVQPSSPELGETKKATLRPALSRAERIAAEVEVRYALHRAGACQGDSIEVLLQDGGPIVVRGFVPDRQRREELARSLEELSRDRAVRVELRDVAEWTASAAFEEELESGERLHPREPLVQEDLERYLSRLPAEMTVQERITRHISEALAASRTGLAEAGALRQLFQRYAQFQKTPLETRTVWLLEVMFRDHAEQLRRRLARARELNQPLLGGSLEVQGEFACPDPPASWQEELFSAVKMVHRSSLALLAPAGAGGTGADAAAGGNKQRRLAELKAAFPQAARALACFERKMASELSGSR